MADRGGLTPADEGSEREAGVLRVSGAYWAFRASLPGKRVFLLNQSSLQPNSFPQNPQHLGGLLLLYYLLKTLLTLHSFGVVLQGFELRDVLMDVFPSKQVEKKAGLDHWTRLWGIKGQK